MKFHFDTNYTDEEMAFIKKNNCEILSEIKLSKVAFTENPRRMINYSGTYVAEVCEEDTGELCWAVLTRNRKGFHDFAMYSPTLQIMANSL